MHSSATNHSKIYKPSASLLCPRHLWLCREAQAKAAGNSGKHREMPADPQGYSPIAEMPISWTQMTQMTILWTLNFWNTILTYLDNIHISDIRFRFDDWCLMLQSKSFNTPKTSLESLDTLWKLWTYHNHMWSSIFHKKVCIYIMTCYLNIKCKRMVIGLPLCICSHQGGGYGPSGGWKEVGRGTQTFCLRNCFCVCEKRLRDESEQLW